MAKTMTEKALAANRANAKLGGQPPSITDEEKQQIYELIRAGVPQEASVLRVGVPRSTYYDWLSKGRQPDAREPYATFSRECERALADWETRDILIIGKAAETQWQAAAWRLERRKPNEYGRRTRIEGEVTVVARPFIDVAKLTLDEQRLLRDLLVKAQPASDELPTDARAAIELMPGDFIEEDDEQDAA